ncbi:hypothetical protein PP1_011320 [Pseudonocardia sp. P1]
MLVVVAGLSAATWWTLGSVESQRENAVAETSRSVETLLSYDFREGETDDRLQLLGDGFREQYAGSLRDKVAPAATAQASIVRTRVAESSVLDESRGELTLLLFLDRTETSGAAPEPAVSGSRVTVRAIESGGRWLVDDLRVV